MLFGSILSLRDIFGDDRDFLLSSSRVMTNRRAVRWLENPDRASLFHNSGGHILYHWSIRPTYCKPIHRRHSILSLTEHLKCVSLFVPDSEWIRWNSLKWKEVLNGEWCSDCDKWDLKVAWPLVLPCLHRAWPNRNDMYSTLHKWHCIIGSVHFYPLPDIANVLGCQSGFPFGASIGCAVLKLIPIHWISPFYSLHEKVQA